MKTLILLSITSLLLACGSSKGINEVPIENPETVNDIIITSYNVNARITHYTPYCGGAAPSPEIIANQTQPQRNTSYILWDLGSDEKSKVHTDSSGFLKLQLDAGKYAIRETYKECTLQEFIAQHLRAPGQYYTDSGSDCYETWWKENLSEFEVTDIDSVYSYQWSTRGRCFTGNNPCLGYSGPYPP